MIIHFTLNGAPQELTVNPGENVQKLLFNMGMHSVRNSDDGFGFAGSDAIIFNGNIVNASLLIAAQLEKADIRTAESLGKWNELSLVQQAMVDVGVVQSGYNDPAAALIITDLLDRIAAPTREEIDDALSGLFSRDAGWQQYYQVIELAVARKNNPQATIDIAPTFRQCGLTAEQMAAQLEAEYIPERKLHLYHCDHRGLPLALISPEGETAWQGEYDEWGNLLGEESAQHLQQSLRLPGQQYDEESGLYYNRNRYYDPLQGRYITQDPIGLRGEWNLYKYPLNPVRFIDSLGLKFHVNGDPSDFNQAVEYLKQDSQMKETIDFLSSSEETINIEYIEGTNVRFNSNNMAIYWNSRASLFCSTELNSKSQSPALGLGHEFAHAQYYLLDKENFMALLSRTDKKYENKEEARVITIIESRAAKTLGECTRGAHSGLPFYRVDGPLQTMKITGTPE